MKAPVKQPRYTMVIQWSDEDQCYVVSLPEWRPHAYTGAHGSTYEEAAKSGREVLELLMEPEPDQPPATLPEPKLYRYPGAEVVNLPQERRKPSKRPRTTRQTA
jgi:antitoxin HicB